MVLFDTAAEMSFVSKRFAERLGIDSSRKPITQTPLAMFNGKTAMAETTKVEFRLQGKQQSDSKLWISCQAIENVCGDRLVPQIDLETEQHVDDKEFLEGFLEEVLKEWLKDVEGFERISIPRRYNTDGLEEKRAVVHIFSDESMVAYGVIVYLVIEGSQYSSASFLLARSRVAPIKKTTIPRLELMGLTLATETCECLKGQLKFEVYRYCLWTDTTSVYYQERTHQPDKVPPFVKRRVTKIRNAIEPSEVRHVPGQLNPADVIRKRMSREEASKPISAKELDRAEREVVQQVQKESYQDEIRCLLGGKPLSEASKIRPLTPDMDRGVLRLGGGLADHRGDCPKNPPILPSGHRAVALYLGYSHRRNYHAGVNHCLAQSGKRYWIPQGRQTLRKVVRRCAKYISFHLKPASASQEVPPEFRVSRSAPFAHVGTDVAGPLFIKQGEERKKIWICVFTCGASRATHLELLRSLSTKEFMMAVRRFKSRRGSPKTFISDNAGAYKKSAGDLQEISRMLRDPSLVEGMGNEGIEWKFNVERAPWMNGFVKRLVGILKSALKKVIGRGVLDYQELETVSLGCLPST